MIYSRENKPGRPRWGGPPAWVLKPRNLLIATVLGVFTWLAVVDRAALLAWSCFAIWIFAEASALPPVIAAKKRGHLMPGENAMPWVQALVACTARASYYFTAPTSIPFDVGLGAVLALGCAAYTGLVALRLSSGPTAGRMTAMAWLGITIPAIIRWLCPPAVGGTYFVSVLALNRMSLWAGIPRAIRDRDGRYFCDLWMVCFNLACAVLWFFYSLVLGDVFILANTVVAMGFMIPCLVLKALLHPIVFGKADAKDFKPPEPKPFVVGGSGPGVSSSRVSFDKPGAQMRSRSHQFAPPSRSPLGGLGGLAELSQPPIGRSTSATSYSKFSPALRPRSEILPSELDDSSNDLEPLDFGIETLDLGSGGLDVPELRRGTTDSDLVRSIANMDAAAVSDIVLGTIDSLAESLFMPLAGFGRGISLSSGYCGPPTNYTTVETINLENVSPHSSITMSIDSGPVAPPKVGFGDSFSPLRIPSELMECGEGHEPQGIDGRSSIADEPSSKGLGPRLNEIRESGEYDFRNSINERLEPFSGGSDMSPQYICGLRESIDDVDSQSHLDHRTSTVGEPASAGSLRSRQFLSDALAVDAVASQVSMSRSSSQTHSSEGEHSLTSTTAEVPQPPSSPRLGSDSSNRLAEGNDPVSPLTGPPEVCMNFPEFDDTENGNSVTELLPKRPSQALSSNFFDPPARSYFPGAN